MTAIERTKKRISSLIDWLRDLQSVDPQADRDYPEDLYNLAIDDLHAISFEYQTLAREVERLKAELVRNADEFRETLTELRQRVGTLTAERDEARRYICDLSWEDKRELATKLGWDCFKEASECSNG